MDFSKKRVLVGSPVHQKPSILREFLQALGELEQETVELSYYFIDDNVDDESRALLHAYASSVSRVRIQPSNCKDDYERNETTHEWNETLIWKVADFKDSMIRVARDENYDALFLIDSDLILHPKTLECLVAANKDIISEIFWTAWQPNTTPLPQVWVRDQYTLWHQARGEILGVQEIQQRVLDFLKQLKVPGVYEVGGLGACTLIGRHALNSGVSFKPIRNLSMSGEDRHFCIRSSAMGFSLYVDTHYPCYHIYRESDLDGVAHFKGASNTDECNL